MFMQNAMIDRCDDCSMYKLKCICLNSLIDCLHNCSMHRWYISMYAYMYTHIHTGFYDRLLGPLKHAYVELHMFMLRAFMHAYICMLFTVFLSSLINWLDDCCMHGLDCVCCCRALWPIVWMIVVCICWIAYVWARWSISCTIAACISCICLCIFLWSLFWTIAACISWIAYYCTSCVYACIRPHIHAYTHVRTYARICNYMCTYAHICTHIHTCAQRDPQEGLGTKKFRDAEIDRTT